MKEQDIHLSDWQRILVGDFPGLFYVELFIRVCFVFILIIASMRLMGKRMSAQISRNEMAALVSLAAAIGVPLQSPDRGLLPALAIAIVVVLTQRWISVKAFGNQKTETFAQGNISMLINNGVMDKKVMLSVRMTRERLFAQVRSQGIKHLGEIKRMYLEANGSFTLIKEETISPGLTVIPDWDKEMLERAEKSGTLVCSCCGKIKEDNTQSKCVICGSMNFENGIQA